MEYKDKLWGGIWDWKDLFWGTLGGILGQLLQIFIVLQII
jgi:hypothetical protein